MMTRTLREAGLASLIAGDLEVIASGFQFTEGPLWLPDGRLLFQDLKASQTWQWTSDGGARVLRSDTRGANGQTVDSLGQIVFCEQDGRRVSRMKDDGFGVTPVVERFEGKRLNSPNDIICGRGGAVYFTDPAYGVARPEDKELPFQGVFRMGAETDDLQLVAADGFEKPNGLALSADERTLYVNDTGRYHVRALQLSDEPGAPVRSDRVLARFDPSEPGGPDGVKLDVAGRLYVAVAEGVWVVEPDGRLLGILATPKRPSNLAWGGADAKTLFITAVDQVLSVRLNVEGQMPPFASRLAEGRSPASS